MARVYIYLALLIAATAVAVAGIHLGYIAPLEGAGLLAVSLLAMVIRLALRAPRPGKSDHAQL